MVMITCISVLGKGHVLIRRLAKLYVKIIILWSNSENWGGEANAHSAGPVSKMVCYVCATLNFKHTHFISVLCKTTRIVKGRAGVLIVKQFLIHTRSFIVPIISA